MPFIKISALQEVPNKDKLMQNVEQALYDCQFRNAPLMPQNMATCLWQTLDSIIHKGEVHHAFEKEKAEVPVFVDLYVNRIFNHEGISLIMETIADTLSGTGEINKKNIFIHVHEGNPGFIYINGAVSYQPL
jgi:hypothetical protein